MGKRKKKTKGLFSTALRKPKVENFTIDRPTSVLKKKGNNLLNFGGDFG